MRKALVGLLSLGAAVLVAACAGASSAAPRSAFMVCGQALWNYGAMGPDTVTYAAPGNFRLRAVPSATFPVLLKLTDDCASGVRISINHPHVVKIHARARARDGLVAGISILTKGHGQTTLTAIRPSGATTRIAIGLP